MSTHPVGTPGAGRAGVATEQLSGLTAPKDRIHVRRRRGAVAGLLLMALGAWGAIVAFIGPSFSFGYGPGDSWTWTGARGWFEVLPGAVAFVAGLILLCSANRLFVLMAATLGAAAGAWFVVGPQVAHVLTAGSLGAPTATTTRGQTLESLAYFYALGAVILFVSAAAFGRLSVRTVSDMAAARERLMTPAVSPVAPVNTVNPAFAPAPATAARPVAPQPVAPQPVAAQPVAAQPVAAQPVAAQPVAAQPVAAQPVAPSGPVVEGSRATGPATAVQDTSANSTR